MKRSLLQVILFHAFVVASIHAQQGSLQVVVTDLQNDRGQVGVLVFTEEKGYPNDHKKAVASKFGEIRDGQASILIEELPYGPCVLTVMHDENGNGKLDKDLFGRPKEGYGVSNDPAPRTFGPPRFEDGVVDHQPDTGIIKIRMRYD